MHSPSVRLSGPTRLACHAIAELPFVIVAIVTLAAGWRPTSDDAVFSWRAWNVISSHPTLLGAPTQAYGVGKHAVFAPGPAMSWLLAVPVHVSPQSGPLIGSALIAVVAVALSIEAAWSTGRELGALIVAAAVIVLIWSQPRVVFNPVWTPWIGVLWLLAALSSSWAVASGRFRWWPIAVLSGSIAAQCHLVFALPAIGVTLAAPIVGLALRRGPVTVRKVIRGGLPGVIVGAVVWLPTLIDQMVNSPGNLSLLWRSGHQAGSRFGWANAIRGLSSATGLRPSWLHVIPTTGTFAFLKTGAIVFGGSPVWGWMLLVVLIAIALVASMRQMRRLAAASWIATVASVLTVVTIAGVPAANVGELDYLSVVYWPVGMMMWAVMATATLLLSIRLTRRLVSGIHSGSEALAPWMAAGAAVLLVVVMTVSVTRDTSSIASPSTEIGGPGAVAVSARAVAAVERVAPKGPFELRFENAASPWIANTVYSNLAYSLWVSGWQVRFPPALAVMIVASLASAPGTPEVVVNLGGGSGVSAHRIPAVRLGDTHPG